jgi:hypothetical protein
MYSNVGIFPKSDMPTPCATPDFASTQSGLRSLIESGENLPEAYKAC